MGRKSNEKFHIHPNRIIVYFWRRNSSVIFIVPLIHTIRIADTTVLGIWQVTESAADMLTSLRISSIDRALINTYKNETRKKQVLACRMILSHFLNPRELQLEYDEFGKPFLKNRNEFISLSHSGMVSAAIINGQGPAGIDIEIIRDRIGRVSDRFLTKAELAGIDPEHRLEWLYVCWCGKEALYKLYGKPEVDLKNDILIHSFDYFCTGKGSCWATLTTPEYTREFELYYEKLGEYMFVYTY